MGARAHGATMKQLLCVFLLCLSACAFQKPDYRRFREYQPKSIVVLPPINTSNTIRAPEIFLASIAQPIGEAGYYVFPPVAVLHYFRSQGVPSGAEAQHVSQSKLQKVFGADAALYTIIEEWGEKYQIISAQNLVRVHFSLIDLKTGIEIWEARGEALSQPSNNNGVVGALVGSLLHGILNNSAYDEYVLSQQASFTAMHNMGTGLLIGAKRPNFSEDERGREQR